MAPRREDAGGMTEFDTRVQDPAALAEIELYGDLVVAATVSDGPLATTEIDRLLGLERLDSLDSAPGDQPKRPEM